MATEFIGRVVPGGIRAADAAQAEALEGLVGQEVTVTVRKGRNPGFHRKFMALLTLARHMDPETYTAAQYRTLVTVGAGWCEYHATPRGIAAVPKSISFARMDDTEFQQLYSDALTFLCDRLGQDREALEALVDFM